MKVTAFFKNRYVLYITVILGVTNLLGYIGMENYDAMALLVVMFLLARYFSKNIAINICIAIFVTSIVTLNGKLHEGFKEGNYGKSRGAARKPKKYPTGAGTGKNATTEVKGKKKQYSNTNSQRERKEISKPQDPVKPEDPEEPEEPPKEEPPKEEPPKDEEPECPKGTEMGPKGECVPSGERFRNNVPSSSPAKVNGSGDDDMNVAAKMEDAYGNLNKMLGDGAMSSMATETKKLVAQQQELMNTLSSMTPSLNKAKETLSNLNIPNMEEMTGILKKFTQ